MSDIFTKKLASIKSVEMSSPETDTNSQQSQDGIRKITILILHTENSCFKTYISTFIICLRIYNITLQVYPITLPYSRNVSVNFLVYKSSMSLFTRTIPHFYDKKHTSQHHLFFLSLL
jgi:hypothetical protein